MTHDVIIIGGAFSGASAGILLKRARPAARVLIVERAAAFDRKVGESTSEVAACFLTRVLRVAHHLNRHQLTKQGLRMWFTTPENTCPARCTEIGAWQQARLPTYQLDRQVLDEHLLELARKEGCELWRPARVEELTLAAHSGAAASRARVKIGDETREATAPWVIDASGKAAMLARKLGHWRRLETHPTNSLWARFRGVRDLDGPELAARHPEFAAAVRCSRDLATNHLMGRGWWCWIIPLRDGDVSLGITYDPRLFTPPQDGAIPARLLAHVMRHPVGRFLFENASPVEHDARAYAHLPYYSEQVAGPGWAIVGDAAGFMDPLYSQGLDYCAHSVYTAHRFIAAALAGEDVTARREAYNSQFKESYFRWYHSLYHEKYEYLGEADLVNAAFLMDLACYFLGPVRLVHEQPEVEFALLPYQGRAGAWFARFMRFYNGRLARLARRRAAAGVEGRANLDRRWLVRQGFAPVFKVTTLLRRGIFVWLRAEWRALWLPRPPAARPAPAPAPEAAPGARG